MFEAIQFSSFSEFIQMGSYAFNVWTVYGLFAIFVAVNLYFPLRQRKQIIREHKRRILINNERRSKTTDAEAAGTLIKETKPSHAGNSNQFSNPVGGN